MPHLVFRNVKEAQVKEWSSTLLPQIAEELAVPEHRVTFSFVESRSYLFGKDMTDHTAFVEIHWLPRPIEKKIALSKMLEETLKEAGWENPIIWYHEFGPESCWYQGEFLTKPPIIK